MIAPKHVGSFRLPPLLLATGITVKGIADSAWTTVVQSSDSGPGSPTGTLRVPRTWPHGDPKTSHTAQFSDGPVLRWADSDPLHDRRDDAAGQLQFGDRPPEPVPLASPYLGDPAWPGLPRNPGGCPHDGRDYPSACFSARRYSRRNGMANATEPLPASSTTSAAIRRRR